MKQRVFVSLTVPEPVKQETSALQQRLSALSLVRWEPLDKLHLTVAFLGLVSNGDLDQLSSELKDFSAGQPRLPLEISSVTAFPKWSAARVVCFLVQRSPELVALRRQLNNQLQIILPARRTPYSFQPHITIGRVSGRPVKLPELEPLPLQIKFSAATLDIMESTLRPDGSTYRLLKRFPLSG